jgi:hypothetical protein
MNNLPGPPRPPNSLPGDSRDSNPLPGDPRDPNPIQGPPNPPNPTTPPNPPPKTLTDPMNSKLMKNLIISTFLVIVLCSIILIVYGAIFMEFYFLDKVENWLYNAMVLPFYMITLGSVTLILGKVIIHKSRGEQFLWNLN